MVQASHTRILVEVSVLALVILAVVTNPATAFIFGDDDFDEIPQRISGSEINDLEYADLWYGITTLDKPDPNPSVAQYAGIEDDEYQQLIDSFKENVGDGSSVALELEDRHNQPKDHIQDPKPHTATWNNELHSKDIGDVSTHLADNKVTSNDAAVDISNVGFDVLTIDPHADYIPNTDDKWESKEYICDNANVTIAGADAQVGSAQSTEVGGGGCRAESKTTYSIDEIEENRTLTVRVDPIDTLDGHPYEKVIKDAYDGGEISKPSIELPDRVEGGAEVRFVVRHQVKVTEEQKDYSRSCHTVCTSRDKEGSCTSHSCECGSWGSPSISYNTYTHSYSDTVKKTNYKPEVDIDYQTVKNPETNESVMFFDVDNDQPIAGVKVDRLRETGTLTRQATFKYPNIYVSASDPMYRDNFGTEGILPVNHIVTPGRDTITVSGPARGSEQRSYVGGYSNPSQYALDLSPGTVRSTTGMTAYGRVEGNITGEEFSVTPIVPGSEINLDIFEEDNLEINSDTHSVKEVNIDMTRESLETTGGGRANIDLNIATSSDSEPISTSDYDSVELEITQGLTNADQIETDPSTTISYENINRPTYIEAELVQNTSQAIDSGEPILVGETARYEVDAPTSELTSTIMNIFHGLTLRVIWYLVPTVTILALITKGLTGYWIPYLN